MWPTRLAALAVSLSQGTVFNVKRRFAMGGLDGVLKEWPTVGFAY